MQDAITFAESVYVRYAELMRCSPAGLVGSLLLATLEAENPEQTTELTALVRAANTAGAATLLIGSNPETGRAQVRSGVCDFLVTTLDEALRILKNEIRRRRQVAVYLLSEPSAALRACVDRGVQPQLLAAAEQTLQARGAHLIAQVPVPSELERLVWWQSKGTPRLVETLAVEAMLYESEQGQDTRGARRRWLASAPQYLGRDLAQVRSVPMANAEAESFHAALRDAAGRLPSQCAVWRGGINLAVSQP